MSDHIPGEVLIQILARLPVKSLLKFRCVSKSWYSLISSPDFINYHLSLNNNTNNYKFLFFKHTVGEDECFFSLNYEDTLDEYERFVFLDKHARFEDSFTSSNSDFKIVGSCNGLVCVWNDFDIILWNPSIKKYVTLPTPNITRLVHEPTDCVFGFGFDNRANDYKVVRLVNLSDHESSNLCPPEVELCELSKGSWRGISCNAPPYFFKSCHSQAYINGVVHWIALDKRNGPIGDRSLIVAFDMVNEVFREMALPDSVVSFAGVWKDLSIGTYEESLVVYHLKRTPLNNQCSCSVWVMKEYGVAKSWVSLFNIVLGEGLNNVQSLMKNGELLLRRTSGHLVLCNPKDQQTKDVEFYDPSTRSWYVDIYMESLILLKGRQTDSCYAVISKRKEDEIEEQQYPTILEEAKTKKTRVEIGVGSSESLFPEDERFDISSFLL